MFFIVDLIVIAILLLCVFTGYKRGLTGCLIKIFSFLIAIVVAFILFKPISNIVIDNTNYDEKIQTSIVEMFENNDKDDNGNSEYKSPIMTHISNEIEDAAEEKKKEIVNNVATSISVKVINVLVFICLFILTRLLLIFVKALTNLITKLPLIKQCDKIGGIIYGILQGLVILFILFALITFISTITNQYALLEIINKSYIASILCNNNILLNIVF